MYLHIYEPSTAAVYTAASARNRVVGNDINYLQGRADVRFFFLATANITMYVYIFFCFRVSNRFFMHVRRVRPNSSKKCTIFMHTRRA